MNGIIFDLKSFRAKQLNGMSQEDFARQVGISQDKVSRMESDPSQVSLDVLIKIATHFGMSLDELIRLPKPIAQALQIDYTWSSAEFIRRTLLDYIAGNDVADTYQAEIKELSAVVEKTLRKPKVAFIGRSDVGKSTMINTLLGSERMPARWTPATAIAVYVKHINNRPDYMGNDEVWVFQSNPDSDEVWDDTRLEDQAYCRSLRLSSGNYDLLNTYGTRSGEHFAESKATAAVVFIDSSLLLNCDIVDLPGYGTGDRLEDDALSLREKSKADVLVYLSIANGFMRSEDISYIKDAIPSLPDIQSCGDAEIKPLANLFIVASQAHVIDNGNQAELKTIIDAGCDRLEKSLTEEFWSERRKPDALVDRFYAYTSNSPLVRERFEKDFCAILEVMPQVIEQRAGNIITQWVQNKDADLRKVIDGYQQLLDDRKKCEESLKEYDRNEPKRHAEFQRAKQRVVERIGKYRNESKGEIEDYYRTTITVDNLISLMERRGIRKKKEDLQVFSTYVSGLLQDKTNAVLKGKSNLLASDINDFLNAFEVSTTISVSNISFKLSPFSKEQAFAAGLTGVATYGALAVWAASCGNLGGYILVAKGVSLLSSLGISVGGTAAATSAVAAIGGPVVLGVALALIAATTVFAVFSGGWKKSVAKKFVESCRDERVLDKLQTNINTYWNDTQAAFVASADRLNTAWKTHIDEIRQKLQSNDVDAIIAAKEEAEKMRNFLRNIPC